MLNHFIFAFLSNTQFISLAMLLKNILGFSKPILSKVNDVKSNKSALARLKLTVTDTSQLIIVRVT